MIFRALITVPGRDPIEFTDAEGKDMEAWRAYAFHQFGRAATVSVMGDHTSDTVSVEGEHVGGDHQEVEEEHVDHATEVEDLQEAFEERAGILEYDAGLPRAEAELEAARITSTYARNRGYAWASLRSALSGYPVLLSQVPATAGTIDSLPLGTATVHVRKGGTVVRQGDFTGASEVKS